MLVRLWDFLHREQFGSVNLFQRKSIAEVGRVCSSAFRAKLKMQVDILSTDFPQAEIVDGLTELIISFNSAPAEANPVHAKVTSFVD